MEDARVHGKASATIKTSLDKAWAIASDFYALDKWVPSVEECYEIETNVRFCKSKPTSDGTVTWVKEELLVLDHEKHIVSYRIIDGNMGLDDYEATMQLSCGGEDGSTTLLNWSFAMSPSSTKTKESQEGFLKYGIQSLEKKAESLQTVPGPSSD